MENGKVLPRTAVPAGIPRGIVWLLGLDIRETNKRLVWLGLIAATVMVVAALLTRPGDAQLTVSGSWAITMAMVLLFLAALGLQRLFRVGGILIGDRNLMSLSRFQITGWTVMIGSALVAVGLARAFDSALNFNEALDIIIPAQVWQLLGISGASTVLATMVKKGKEQKEPVDAEKVATRTAQLIPNDSQPSIERNRRGLLYGNEGPEDARFLDMIEGDEIANAAYLDIGKVQMFLFTVFAFLMYGATLWQLFAKTDPAMITEFPGLTPTMVTIIGLSHAAYLGTKWVDQTTVDPAAVPPSGQDTAPHEDDGELDA
jgi:hypothetical protein